MGQFSCEDGELPNAVRLGVVKKVSGLFYVPLVGWIDAYAPRVCIEWHVEWLVNF